MVERRTFLTGFAALGALTVAGCSRDSEGRTAPTTPPTSTAPTPTPTQATTQAPPSPTLAGTVATGLNVPWAIAFLANGDALVSQRDEASVVRISTAGDVTTLGEVPGISSGGEAGLLGIALAPGDESTLFAYVTTSRDNRVVTMSLDGGTLGRPTPIIEGIPVGGRHHGGRLLFGADGNLFVATGDAGDGANAQDRDSLGGKILRVGRDGKAAAGNPFGNRVWTYGHRNVEGLAFDADGRLWATEFGERKADELNLITKGGNYGWPQVEGTGGGDGQIDPLITWRTNECSPAGLAITRGVAFLGALQGRCVFAVPLDGETAGKPTAYFQGDHGRIRHVAVAPDGALWVTTSNTDGRATPSKDDDVILRVTL